MMKVLIASAVALFACHLSSSQANELSAPVLRSVVTVTNPTVSLADLVDGANLPSDSLFLAPPPGQSGTIRASRVVEAAQRAGIKALLGDVSGWITITRRGRLIGADMIDTALKQAIRAKGAMEQPDFTLANGATLPDLYVEDGVPGGPVISDLKIDHDTLHFSANVSVPGSATLAKEPLRLDGQIADMVDILVTIHALNKNDTLSASDVRIEKRDRKTLAGIMPVKLSGLAGQAARGEIITGSILTEDLVMRAVLVEKSMAVSVTYAVGGLRLTLHGKANESGALGDVIPVLNTQSKKVIFATVTGPASVAIPSDDEMPALGKQAANTLQ